jgi:iron(III) transport system permease protein
MPHTSDKMRTYGIVASGTCLLLAVGVHWLTADAPLRRMLLHTFQLCGGAAAISLPVGVLLAMLLTRTNVAGRSFSWLLLLTLLFLPLHATAAGWVAVFGKLGSQAPAFFQTAHPLVEGMPAVIWIHAMASIPWVTLIISLGLAAIPQEVEEAALLDISPARFFLGIGLRYYLPFVLAAALWVVITAAGEMTVTNLYVVATYAEELYNSVAQGADAPTAGLKVLPGIVGTVLLAAAVCGMIAALLPAGLGNRFLRPRIYSLGAWRWPATMANWLVLLLVFGVPLVSLIYKAGLVKQVVGGEQVRSWSLTTLFGLLATMTYRFRWEFSYSADFAAAGTAVALGVGLPLALLARRGGVRGIPAVMVAALCWSLPGPLVGISLTWLLNWNFGPLIFLYDKTPLAPALALGIKALPITILILWGALASIPRQTLEAARLDGAGNLALLTKIILPQRASAIAAAGVIAFAIGLGDLAWSILLLHSDTVQRRVFGLIHYGVEEQVAAVSLVTLAMFFVLALSLQVAFLQTQGARKPT